MIRARAYDPSSGKAEAFKEKVRKPPPLEREKCHSGKKIKTFGEKKKDFWHLKMDSKDSRADWQGEEEREKLRKVGVELS